MTWLLDTNACISYLRGHAILVPKVTAHAPADLRICPIVLAELCYGAYRSAHPQRELRKVADFARLFRSLPFNRRAAKSMGHIRATLATKGTPIGPYDLQIAATALAHKVTLVTHNTAEFGRVPGLVIEDWELP